MFGHLIDLGMVKGFQIAHKRNVLFGNQINGHTLSPKTSRSSNAMDVILTVKREIVVDDERDLLDVDAPCEKVGTDEYPCAPMAEIIQDVLALHKSKVAVDTRHRKVPLCHLVLDPVHLTAGITIQDTLIDGEGLVQVQ